MNSEQIDPHRRKFIATVLGVVSSLFFSSSANSATKPPVKKAPTKPVKRVKKSPPAKVVQKPVTPSPTRTQMPVEGQKSTQPPSSNKAPATPSVTPNSSTSNSSLPSSAILLRISSGPLKTLDIPLGSTAISTTGDRGEGQTLFITKESEGRFRAFLAICTHQGGNLQLRPEGLKCNKHGALFNPRTGGVIHSAPRDLPEEEIFIKDDLMYWIPVEQ